MSDGDLTAVADRVLGRRFRIEGRLWTVAALMAGPKPWAWLVDMKNPERQARLALAALERMEPEEATR